MTTSDPALKVEAAERVAGTESGWPLVWALSLAQLVSWGSIYYGFSLFVVPMEAELGWSRTRLVGGFASTVFIPLTQLFIDRLGWRDALIALALCNLAICLPIHAVFLKDGAGTRFSPAALDEIVADDALRRALRHPVFWALAI